MMEEKGDTETVFEASKANIQINLEPLESTADYHIWAIQSCSTIVTGRTYT